jgi:hypothetical protein
MRNFTKTLILAIMMITFTANAFSQFSANTTANATATVVTPIAIAKTADLAFGTFTVGIVGGTVQVTTAPARNASADITVLGTSTFSPAAFNVTGTTGATYAITLPANGTVTIANGGNTMAVDNFVSNPAVGSNPALVAGPNALVVGATLTVGASQVAGPYTGTFSVTVGYN